MTFDELDTKMKLVLDKWEPHAHNRNFGGADQWVLKISNIKSLGSCRYGPREIVLNNFMVENCEDDVVIDTLLHECAHALCGVTRSKTGRVMGHGRAWKMWARMLGCQPKATVPLSSLGETAERHFTSNSTGHAYKYHIVYVNGDQFEIVSTCKRKLKNLHNRGMKGRRETMGRLYHIEIAQWERYKNAPHYLITKIFR